MYVGIILGLIMFLFVACGSSQDNMFSSSEWETSVATPAVPRSVATSELYMSWSEVADDSEMGHVDWEDVAGTAVRHIIQTANVELETEYFDEVVTTLRQLAPNVNGYVESEMLSVQNRRRFTIVLRVPSVYFDTVLRQVENLADVRATTQRAEDVTDRFYDMASSLETRRIEEVRILELIDTTQNISELLTLESRLSNTRQVIQQYEAQLNNLAGQIAYSTIIVHLQDISQQATIIAAPTLGERIGGAFGDSVDTTVNGFQNIIVFLAGAVIPLTILGLITFAIYRIIRTVHKKLTPSRP